MAIIEQTVAEKIVAYLRHDISVAHLVSWTEVVMTDAEFKEIESPMISVVATRATDFARPI